MTINVELLRKTLEHITAHPEEHDQKYWACGTTMCLAGHAVQIAGHELDWIETWRDERLQRFLPAISSSPHAFMVTTGDLIPSVARRELGLSEGQAKELFADGHTICQLWRLAHSYTDGQIEVPERCDGRGE